MGNSRLRTKLYNILLVGALLTGVSVVGSALGSSWFDIDHPLLGGRELHEEYFVGSVLLVLLGSCGIGWNIARTLRRRNIK